MIFYPTKRELMDAILEVLKSENTMSTSEIDNAVAIKLNLSEEHLSEESSNCYRMRWARTELKQRHLITNPKRGTWILL